MILKISEIKESKTNPRGEVINDQAFKDLVDSIKEKGVLVPIIVRTISGKVELVAGHRRLAASKVAGIKTIQAISMDLSDDETLEVQIIENLQRQDVHPVDEGESYRNLIEKSKYEIKSLSIKVGKSESYIRQRLVLTNLSAASKTAYKKGLLMDGHALVLSRLTPEQQFDSIKWIKEESPSISDLNDYVAKEYDEPLKNQPWLKIKNGKEVVGPCTKCPLNINTLFGDREDGHCVDLNCWNIKMKRYEKHLLDKNQGAVKISLSYWVEDKKILSSGQYKSISTNKKSHCKLAVKGVVSEGESRGRLLDICFDPKCTKHSAQHVSYKRTEAEKESARKEKEKAQLQQERDNKQIYSSLEKITWPVEPKTLDIIVELIIAKYNITEHIKPVVQRHEWDLVKKESSWSKRIETDWVATMRSKVAIMNDKEKLRLILEIMLEAAWEDPKKKILTMINS